MISTNIIGLAGFGCLAGLAGIEMIRRQREPSSERGRPSRVVNILIRWVVVVSAYAGISQTNLWPLSSWSLMTGAPTPRYGERPPYLRIMAVAPGGREYAIDYRAVEPFAIEELMGWMRASFLFLPPAEQDRAAAYLLERLNVARSRVRDGSSPGTQERFLGPLRAPFHLLHPKRWTSPDSVPAAPFTGLRVYHEQWDLEAKARDRSRFSRELIYSFHSPAVALR